MKLCKLCEQPFEGETEKDIRVLRENGLSIREIAKSVNKSSSTVFYHLKKVV